MDNEAHGGLFGVYMNKDGLPGCSHIRGFFIWRSFDHAIYFQVAQLDLSHFRYFKKDPADLLTRLTPKLVESILKSFLLFSSSPQTVMSMVISDVTLVDNGLGIMSFIYTPASLSHAFANKTVHVQVPEQPLSTCLYLL